MKKLSQVVSAITGLKVKGHTLEEISEAVERFNKALIFEKASGSLLAGRAIAGDVFTLSDKSKRDKEVGYEKDNPSAR